MQEFFLSTEVPLDLDAKESGGARPRWVQVPDAGIEHPALQLSAGESLTLAAGLCPGPDARLLLRYGGAQPGLLAGGAATLGVSLVFDGHAERLGGLEIPAGKAGQAPREGMFDLAPYAGRTFALRVQVEAAPRLIRRGGPVALYEAVVAPVERMDNVRARAFHVERARAELAHFSTAYDHAMYQPPRVESDPSDHALRCRSLEDLLQTGPDDGTGPARPAIVEPGMPSDEGAPRQDAYHYAHHLLTRQLRAVPPDFHRRLRELAERKAGGPLRILSLCCGAARIEASFASALGVPAHWTLMDLNEGLLRSAAAAFPPGQSIELIAGNLNGIADYGERYDVILCVSGLHHIVELERVVGFIRDALVEGGEFWSIGEAIGRNGNRLWSHDQAAANAFFRQLPDRLRRNRHTGVVDESLPDVDYSTGTFEGIRSQDIEPLLSRRLQPVDLYRRNCFLWRLVDLSYADNYDMQDPADLEWLQRAVRAELAHFHDGGRPTELHGVFRRPAM